MQDFFCYKPAVPVDKIKLTPCTKVILIIPLMYRTHLSAGADHFTAQSQGEWFPSPLQLLENPADQRKKERKY